MRHCRALAASAGDCGGVAKRLPQAGTPLSLPYEVRATGTLPQAVATGWRPALVPGEAFYSRLAECHREVPTQIPGLTNVIEAAAGDAHTIFVLGDGTAFTVGDGT